jgi:putative adenylate-forming enzyme
MILTGLIDYFRLVVHRTFYSEKRNRTYQEKQLRKLYQYAIKNSPFYQELYKDNPFETMEDFYQLPTVNKTIMMDHFSTLNTCGIEKDDVMKYAVQMEKDKTFLGYYQDKYVVGLSSGTSGNKGIYITPKEITKRLPAVFLARGGFPLRLLPYRILFMLRVFSQGFEDINSKIISLNYLSTMEDIQIVIKRINNLKINILMAPPSFIRELLPYKDQINVPIKRIMTYAEVLEEEDKARFEKDFNTRVIEIYQASEGQIASACKEGHLHINEDLVFVELYDEEDNFIVEPNVVGHKMILTNLVNTAQPLIRYEMNDMIILDEPCECGSKFRRIKKILGRHDDLLYFYNKDKERKYIFPDLFVRWIIVVSDNIREFQVFQKEINKIRIVIDFIHDNNSAIEKELHDKITDELKCFGIHSPIIEIEHGKIELPKDKNKFKRFISEVKVDIS